MIETDVVLQVAAEIAQKRDRSLARKLVEHHDTFGCWPQFVWWRRPVNAEIGTGFDEYYGAGPNRPRSRCHVIECGWLNDATTEAEDMIGWIRIQAARAP